MKIQLDVLLFLCNLLKCRRERKTTAMSKDERRNEKVIGGIHYSLLGDRSVIEKSEDCFLPDARLIMSRYFFFIAIYFYGFICCMFVCLSVGRLFERSLPTALPFCHID